MSDTDKLIAKLDEIKCAMSLPFEHRWLDSNEAAALIGISVVQFRQRIACLPDFPTPARPIGRRKWKASEISEWMDANRRRAA